MNAYIREAIQFIVGMIIVLLVVYGIDWVINNNHWLKGLIK